MKISLKIVNKKFIFGVWAAVFGCLFFTSVAAAETLGDAYELPTATTTEFVVVTSSNFAPLETIKYAMKEPTIRVGIYKTDKKVQFISPYIYDVVADYEVLARIPENELVTLTYENGVYNVVSNSVSTTSKFYLRLIPENISNYFSIFNLDRHLVTRSQLNFATFHGIMEYRFSPKSAQPYVINELMLEDYVSGVGETSNGAPEEYIKALQIAARTYAFTNIGPAPTESRMFDVYASTVDQLYLGYNFEQMNPKIVLHSSSTRGQMVTYKDKPVTTYYYSRSNGKTKTKKGAPWLKSVVCKYDKGWSELGHGYGMSNRDAALRAKNDKWDYEKILTYYYSGTKVQKMYE